MSLLRQSKILLGVLLLWAALLFPATAGATIFYVASTSANGASVSSLAINVPTGVAAYDVMVASISVSGGTGTTITPPAGWTLVSRVDSTTTLAQAVYYRVAGAGEPASYTWTFGAAVTKVAGG